MLWSICASWVAWPWVWFFGMDSLTSKDKCIDSLLDCHACFSWDFLWLWIKIFVFEWVPMLRASNSPSIILRIHQKVFQKLFKFAPISLDKVYFLFRTRSQCVLSWSRFQAMNLKSIINNPTVIFRIYKQSSSLERGPSILNH